MIAVVTSRETARKRRGVPFHQKLEAHHKREKLVQIKDTKVSSGFFELWLWIPRGEYSFDVPLR